MRTLKYILAIVVCCLVSVKAESQTGCVKLLQQAYDNVPSAELKENQTVYFSFEQEVKFSAVYGGESQSQASEMMANKNESIYLSSLINVYQNREISVTINHQGKGILIGDGVSKEARLSQMNMIQDTIMTYFTNTSCRKIVTKGVAKMEITATINPKGQQLFKVVEIIFVINITSQRFDRITLNYTDGQMLESMTMIYKEINENYTTTQLSLSPLSRVFDENGVLSKYSNYRLTDVRNN